jgi:hypothetical protein
MAKDPTRTYGRRIVPTPHRLMVFMGLAVLIGITPFVYEKTPWFDLIGMWIILCLPLGCLIYLDLGHRMSWNEERIWIHSEGLFRLFIRTPETSIRIADIEWIEGQFDGDAGIKAKFFPFDYMIVYGETEGPEANVLINPYYVHVNSVRELLHHIDYRKPGVLAPEVIAFMHSDKGF